jgi:hypothetical protein
MLKYIPEHSDENDAIPFGRVDILIPRRFGDVENPRGGVRGVIPANQSY